jgi:hypothetical protein
MRLILFILVLTISRCLAQPSATAFPGGTYDPLIPTPESVLGYQVGQRYTDYRNLERYIERLAASSNRIQRVIYGTTYEMRPLQVLIISSPGNLARLDEIRRANVSLTDPRLPKSKGELENLLNSLPAIVWFSYGVHGNEASSPEAALLTLYQLCAGTDRRTLNILDSAVVIIDPAVNPDGRERFVQSANSTAGRTPNVNPEALEHSEPWPRGRTNHYYFDLNRDWAWMTQIESRARIALYRQWMPHVHVDFHEMGYQSSYFFFPAAAPIHAEFPPEVKKWGRIFGAANASAFDALGIPYYTAESFDLFYPSYGDSWPTFNGAIGMTYEQAGQAGTAIRKPSGEILTLAVRARHHLITGFTTLETTVRNRKERLADFRKFWETAMTPSGKGKGFIIRQENDPSRAADMVNILLDQGIEVHQLESTVQLDAQRFFSRSSAQESFPKGTYFISLLQPNSRLAKALLEPHSAIQDTFFYDVSAWSLPVAYGLAAYTTDSPLPAAARKITEKIYTKGKIVNGPAVYAYIIPWEQNNAVKIVWQLLERSFSLSVATRPFDLDRRTFAAGTVIIHVAQNPDSLHSILQRLAETSGIDVYAVQSGLTEKGINLGSNRIRPLTKPRIAVLADAPVLANDFGELWYLFDQEYQIPFTAIRTRDVANVSLSKYNVLILPDASDYKSVFDSAQAERLKRWVQEGGILIGLENGARYLLKNRSGITPGILVTEKKEEEKSKEEKDQEKTRKEAQKRMTWFEKEEQSRVEQIPGSIFRVLVDPTHPIGYGYGRELYALKSNSVPIDLHESAHTVARFSPDTVHVSGYSVPDLSRRVANSAYILEFSQGKGKVVLFAETVTFRMFWKGLHKLLLNTLLFVPKAE